MLGGIGILPHYPSSRILHYTTELLSWNHMRFPLIVCRFRRLWLVFLEYAQSVTKCPAEIGGDNHCATCGLFLGERYSNFFCKEENPYPCDGAAEH
jgi:hypothetical protein